MFLWLKGIIFIFIINFTLIFCNNLNIIQEVISNEILFSDRKNDILFILSKNCSEETFEKLLNGIFLLENKTQNNYSGDDYNIFVQFGNGYNKTFTKNDKFYSSYKTKWCLKDDNCYEAALINNSDSEVTDFLQINKSCPKTIVKEFTVIISDVCLPALNKIILNDKNDCLMEYRRIALMLPTKNDVDKCEKEMLNMSSTLIIDLFSSDLDDNNSINKYSNMHGMYYTTMAESKVNLFLLLVEPVEYVLNYLDQLNLPDLPLCKKGSLVAHFQYMSNDGKRERNAKIALPLNYKTDDFLFKNYINLIKTVEYHEINISNCEYIKEALLALQSQPLQQNQEQFNILFMTSPPPPCFTDFELYWNNTNRHLEIGVLYDFKVDKSDYSKLISLSKNSLNHINFYNPYSNGFLELGNYTAICKSQTLSQNLTDNGTPLTTTVESNNNSHIWLIIAGSVTVTIIIIVVTVFIHRHFYNKRMTKKRMELTKTRTETESFAPGFTKYWNLFFSDKDIIIYYDKILGKGSKSSVFKAVIKTATQEVAAKISTNLEAKDINVIINELNSLVILKEHPNIIQLKGWTLTGSIPIIITELAETNLLQFVKSSDKNFELKLYIQILYQISCALNYLTENKMIHRDIACRNILLTETKRAKLADFGLSCEIKNRNGIFMEDQNSINRFPLKWLSIEALMEGKFSEKSDVWAFGILCYEIFSGGLIPYERMSNQEMIEFIQNGYRLEKPLNASSEIYEMMKSSWNQKPENRNTFIEIKSRLEKTLDYSYLPLKICKN